MKLKKNDKILVQDDEGNLCNAYYCRKLDDTHSEIVVWYKKSSPFHIIVNNKQIIQKEELDNDREN